MADDEDLTPARPRGNVVFLGRGTHLSVEQALQQVLNQHWRGERPLQDVIIVGVDMDGKLFVQNSHVSREWALWLALELVDHCRNTGRHGG